MSKLKMAAAAAVLTIAGGALAAPVTEHASKTLTPDPVNPADPSTTSWTIQNAPFVAVHGPEAGKKNDKFDDIYTFTLSNPYNLVDLGANATIHRGPMVSFSGWTLYDVTTSKTIASAASLISNGVELDDVELRGGTYTFELKGSFVQAKGTYTGYVTAEAVPEPAEAALLLAGLGLVGTLARRRGLKSKA
jgi:hypothetical protein